jgi:hypothetical protein
MSALAIEPEATARPQFRQQLAELMTQFGLGIADIRPLNGVELLEADLYNRNIKALFSGILRTYVSCENQALSQAETNWAAKTLTNMKKRKFSDDDEEAAADSEGDRSPSAPPVAIAPEPKFFKKEHELPAPLQYKIFRNIVWSAFKFNAMPGWSSVVVNVASLARISSDTSAKVSTVLREAKKLTDPDALELFAMKDTPQSMVRVYHAVLKLLKALEGNIDPGTSIVPLMWAAVGRVNPFTQ